MTLRNALSNETSPYLLQHATNPVAWQPWNDTTLAVARKQAKPILLSIGYSACHWCHVMAHESFADPDTAHLMNELFVNIKVDREERPDLDRFYQTAHELLNGRTGGWPLTVFLTPDKLIPYFIGTYFPKTPKYRLPAFADLLRHVSAYYFDHPDEVQHEGDVLGEHLKLLADRYPPHAGPLDSQPLDMARHELGRGFDSVEGGFSEAPKFPHPSNVERLLRHWAATSNGNADRSAHDMALLTLRKMALGGIYDQIGGGFFRYSVDKHWQIPHFEKMLYDNGLLLGVYSTALQISGDPLFERVTRETGHWMLREMQSADGGFFSSWDADSDGEEGKYYCWTPGEVAQICGEQDFPLFAAHSGLNLPPNFEDRSHHLFVAAQARELAEQLQQPLASVEAILSRCRERLRLARSNRAAPARDEKILTGWNGLAIKGLVQAGNILQEPEFVSSARRALNFVRTNLWRDQRLLASFAGGKARFSAYLDDYAFLADGALALLECAWDDGILGFADELASALLTWFEDKDRGGFFYTARDHENLVPRLKQFGDNSLPSGNGCAAYVLNRLGHILGKREYLDAAERCLKAAWPHIEELAATHNTLLNVLEEYQRPPQIIYLRGDTDALAVWRTALTKDFRPRRLVFAITKGGEGLPGAHTPIPVDGAVAYKCDGYACSAPFYRLNDFLAELKRSQ